MTTEEMAEELESRERNERERRGLSRRETPRSRHPGEMQADWAVEALEAARSGHTETLDPRLRPMFTGYTGKDMRQALSRLIDVEKTVIEKLERMNLWDEAKAARRDLELLERLCKGSLPEQLAEKLKEMSMGPEMGN